MVVDHPVVVAIKVEHDLHVCDAVKKRIECRLGQVIEPRLVEDAGPLVAEG